MGKLVTLDEVDEYERELRRAHAENRAPALANPHDVFVETLGNAESLLVEKDEGEQRKETAALHKDQKDQQQDDKRLRGVIRDSLQKTVPGEGSVGPAQRPDPDRFSAPETDEEKEYADRQTDHLVAHGQSFDDSLSDVNIPNLTDDGEVKGDSVNRVFTRKMPTFSEDELVRANEDNAVPVPERFRLENPPQVIQASNPRTQEEPSPEQTGYVEGYAQDESKVAEDKEVFDAGGPSPADVPHTAIKIPRPEHVVGDETGTTREASRLQPKDVEESFYTDPEPTVTVPITDRQVFQGAVKRPGDPIHSLGMPADSLPSNRPEENEAQRAAQKQVDEVVEARAEDDAAREEKATERNEENADEEARKAKIDRENL